MKLQGIYGHSIWYGAIALRVSILVACIAFLRGDIQALQALAYRSMVGLVSPFWDLDCMYLGYSETQILVLGTTFRVRPGLDTAEQLNAPGNRET